MQKLHLFFGKLGVFIAYKKSCCRFVDELLYAKNKGVFLKKGENCLKRPKIRLKLAFFENLGVFIAYKKSKYFIIPFYFL